MDFGIFPNHQINQYGNEADGDESEGDHQPVRSVQQQELLVGAVLEVKRVDVEEEVLNVRVRVKAAHHLRQLLQAFRHVIVWSAKERKNCVLMMNTPGEMILLI